MNEKGRPEVIEEEDITESYQISSGTTVYYSREIKSGGKKSCY